MLAVTVTHFTDKASMRRLASAVVLLAIGMVLALSIIALWMETYPESEDPKNIYYVLWKHGLNGNMNLDHALSAMTHDSWAVNRVQGLSREQLVTRFGYVRTLEQARPYLRVCYEMQFGSGAHNEVVFLRDSNWMVVLENERAVNLVLCKG